MSEEKLNSNKLDIEGANKQNNNQGGDSRLESYKQISEDIGLDHVTGETVKNSNMVRENGDGVAQDGADEKMLSSDDKEALALKNIDVKFIPSDPNLNGDAKIEIGSGEKTFTGMTKEELMKYANDPFWIKLRWFLFILFWLAWIGMLVGAIAIIFLAPKCAAPTPLEWFKKGPLAKIDDGLNIDDKVIAKLQAHNVLGVVFELPANETYLVESNAKVQEKIKGIVEKFKHTNINVVIDLTPNFVTETDELFLNATKENRDEDSLKTFITTSSDLNWKKFNGTASAWINKKGGLKFLSQFGNYYDIRLNNPIAIEKLKGVLKTLVNFGVKGFRLANAKHFIVAEDALVNEEPNPEKTGFNLQDYEFYRHVQTTYVNGIGDLLQTFRNYVKNITNDEGFLSIQDDISPIHASVFIVQNSSTFGFDLPSFGFVNSLLRTPGENTTKKLEDNFNALNTSVDLSSIWTQIQYEKTTFNVFDEEAFKLFVGFLRGVQIASLDDLVYISSKTDVYDQLQNERTSRKDVFEHGNFKYYVSNNLNAFAYSRIKSGNPGLFVVINPSNLDIVANFTGKFEGSSLSMILSNQNVTKGKISIDNIALEKQTTAVFTFVPLT